VVSILISIFGRNALQCFMELTSLGAVIAFAYTSAAAWKIARTQGNRTFAVLGALGTVISVGFLLVQLIPGLTALETMGTDAFLLLTLWCLLGFMFYLRTVSRSSAAAYMGSPTAGVWLFALLLYSALLWLGKRLMAADSLQAVHDTLRLEGPLMLAVVFIALIVSMSLQRTVRKKHDAMAAKHDEATSTTNSDDHA
jgi:hypothetical protein